MASQQGNRIMAASPRQLSSVQNGTSDGKGRLRIIVYIAFAYGLAWLLWFALAYPMATGSGLSGIPETMIQVVVAAGMFAPALAVLLTRLVTREGFGDTWIAPREFRRTWKYYVLGWFGPLVLIVLGGVLYYLIFPNDFDPSMSYMVGVAYETIASTGEAVAVDAETLRTSLLASLLVVPLAPALNFVTCFGEEWGWRGYLLPKMLERHSVLFTVLVTGVIWGVWHAPITALGHNYGFGYPGFPFTGIAAMCAFTIVLGIFFSYITVRSGSCLPAIFAHGMVNGIGQGPLMFSATGGNPFIGPVPTGFVGGAFLIVAGGIALYLMMKREKSGRTQFADGTTEPQAVARQSMGAQSVGHAQPPSGYMQPGMNAQGFSNEQSSTAAQPPASAQPPVAPAQPAAPEEGRPNR